MEGPVSVYMSTVDYETNLPHNVQQLKPSSRRSSSVLRKELLDRQKNMYLSKSKKAVSSVERFSCNTVARQNPSVENMQSIQPQSNTLLKHVKNIPSYSESIYSAVKVKVHIKKDSESVSFVANPEGSPTITRVNTTRGSSKRTRNIRRSQIRTDETQEINQETAVLQERPSGNIIRQTFMQGYTENKPQGVVRVRRHDTIQHGDSTSNTLLSEESMLVSSNTEDKRPKSSRRRKSKSKLRRKETVAKEYVPVLSGQDAEAIMATANNKDFDITTKQGRVGIAQQISDYMKTTETTQDLYLEDLSTFESFQSLYLWSPADRRKEMLTKAIDKKYGMVDFIVLRKKCGLAGMYPKYYLYNTHYQTLMNAKKMTGNKTSHYLMSCEEDVFKKDDQSYVGKLRSNSNKSKYLLFDNGGNVSKNRALGYEQVRSELGGVSFNTTDNIKDCTRDITVAIPVIDDNSQPVSLKQLKKEDSIATRLDNQELSELITFKNQKPTWDKEKHKFVLGFSEKVKHSSCKNFKLSICNGENVDKENSEELYLEFGKISDRQFTLSCRWPFSIINAFAVALTAFDK